MKRLILMRHAKSDWSGGPSSDQDRPLNPRGRKAAAALGKWLNEQQVRPDEILCSSSARTMETHQRLDLKDDIAPQHLRGLYLAPAADILATLRGATGECVLMIGHNPGIGEMAEAILSDAPDHPKFTAYPSGATLLAEFDITDWTQAGWGNANARHFTVPRDL
ncbi:histidine phosphatase family protein [Sulfitobacter sp. M57]|uniref:SixA phosphatase family protein n=1 Tax=unclassified Sulfitobacter TaxID=196795 RepID=UPI0023E2DC4F|nr:MULTISPECIES: histidine phosphatase family protein [unclassified Sulfitobacter]MDF3414446.1 histidine phosphatase family protein [Sulfitobacter sp. KE5]MDF3421927.1 histidine phosphatase family protein [Sulfitobacter sp. KE43]MDF3432992.1 histidine phosphatase family protein [Sulfitobacter sp. KE42]MDF3458632.1 histidine phosphatase family protein [Sulfitobacter sp. S74]MDF3462532.1 histidine phosphatase family protein [Sulfitobacter sp. Ks18]